MQPKFPIYIYIYIYIDTQTQARKNNRGGKSGVCSVNHKYRLIQKKKKKNQYH